MKSKQYRHIELFPEIFNREAFYNKSHPSLNPNTQEYIDYWRQEKKRCIEGWWVEEKQGHWRWMYPKLYFYINHWKIQLIDTVNKRRYYTNPDLTDVEWYMFAYHTAAIGFSGFSGDKKYTCNRLVQKWEQERSGELDEHGVPVVMTKYEKELLMDNPYIKIPFGSFKQYVDPFEYLRLHQSEVLGTPLYDNDPKNEFKMTSRGTGKSFVDASIAGQEFTFNGAKYYDNPLFPENESDRMGIGEIMIGASDPDKTFELAKKVEYGLQNFDGAYQGVDRVFPAPFFKNYMGSFNTNDTYKHRYVEYTKGGVKNVTGSLIYTVNYGSNPHVGASKRLSRQIVDEAAYLEEVDEMHGVSKYSKQAGGVEFGNTSYSCTGGSFEKGEAAKRMFYNPLQYDIYPIKDYWENKGWIGLFIPATYSDRKHKDKNGNTRYENVIEELISRREKLARSPDPLPLMQEKMFNPLKPSEMFYSTRENTLPGELALERINELEEDSNWDRLVSVGKMGWGNKERSTVQWVEGGHDVRKLVITDLFLDKYASKEGSWAVYEHPDPSIETVRYYLVYDPYKKDGQGESFASVLVYKSFPITSDGSRLSDDIVAEYIGRPNTIDDAHKQAVMAAVYFGTKVLVERNVPGFITYCKTEKLSHLLEVEPWDAVKEVNTKKKRTKEFGLNMNGPLKQHCIQLFRQWLMQPTVFDDEGNIRRYNIGKIKSLRLLHEIKDYGDGNFDHISSCLLLMILMQQENLKPMDEKVEERQDEFDDFFKQRVMSFQNPYLN